MISDVIINEIKSKTISGKISEKELYAIADAQKLNTIDLAKLCDILPDYGIQIVSYELIYSSSSANSIPDEKSDSIDAIKLLFSNMDIKQMKSCISDLKNILLLKQNESVIKKDFIFKINNMNLQYSYIAVTLKGFFENCNPDGTLKMDDLVKYYRDFYLNRLSHNLKAEKSNSIFATNDYSDKDTKANILFNPLGRSFLVNDGYFVYDKINDTVTINEELWLSLTRADLIQVENILNIKLQEYYSKI